MLALTLLLLAADPTPADAPVAETPVALAAPDRLQLEAQLKQLTAERPSLRLPVLLTSAGVLFLALGAELVLGAWGWSKWQPSGAWNQATVRYLTASGSGYGLGGLTVSLTGAYLIFKVVRERRAVDEQLTQLTQMLSK